MKTKKIISILVGITLLAGLFSMSGCSKDYSQEVIGTWYCWHWYYNVEDGEDGFYEENDYLTFIIDDSNFSVEKTDGTVLKTGTYEWKKNGLADVYFDDETTCEVEVSFNERDQLKLMIGETKLVYVLETE